MLFKITTLGSRRIALTAVRRIGTTRDEKKGDDVTGV
jgi:hypothetical protein